MLYRNSVAERGLTGIANIFRGRLSGLDDLLRAGTVPLRSPKEAFCRRGIHSEGTDINGGLVFAM